MHNSAICKLTTAEWRGKKTESELPKIAQIGDEKLAAGRYTQLPKVAQKLSKMLFLFAFSWNCMYFASCSKSLTIN